MSEPPIIIKRYVDGYCWACVWANGTPKDKIKSDMRSGDAEFRLFDETTGEFSHHPFERTKFRRFRK